MSDLPRRLSLALLFVVLGFSVYRARTQSFTIDEAWAFRLYTNKPLVEMARSYTAANHVLQSVLMKISAWAFGTGEFAMRIPTLIGAALYLTAVYRLTNLLFRPWMQLVAGAVLVLHPLVLDFFVAARGYGLALGLFTCSLYYVVAYFVKGFDLLYLSRAGIFAGLAIGANLTILVPAAALGVTIVVLLWREYRFRALLTAIDTYGGPAVVLATLVLLFPLLAVEGHVFYFGEQSLFATARSGVNEMLKRPVTPVLAAAPVLGQFVVPAAFWAIAAGAIAVSFRYLRAAHTDYRLAPFAVIAGTLAVTVALLFAGHHAAGVLYPIHRTALYLIPLFTLAALLGLEYIRARRTAAIVFSLLAVAYVTQLEPRFFSIWRFDASTPALLDRLAEDRSARRSTEPARVAASEVLTYSVSYYKIRRRMDWLSLLDNPKAEDADYYLLTGRDRALASSLEVLNDDALSGTLLARRPR
jgi:hypothetical protein